MNAELKGGKLVITIDADEKATKVSTSGKSRIVASSGGNKMVAIKVQGKDVYIGLNAYIKA